MRARSGSARPRSTAARRCAGRCLAVVVCALASCADDGGPRLTSAEPALAAPGALVELRGERFCADHVQCAGVAANVALGLSPPTVAASIVSYADMTATIRIPSIAPAGDTDLVLIVDGRSSNALAFEVLP